MSVVLLVAPAAGLSVHLAVAVATVHRSVATGLERYLSFCTASGAGGGEHLTRSPIITAIPTAAAKAAVTARSPCSSTSGTTLGLVSEALFSVICLVFSAESEALPALLTGKSLFLVAHQ